MFSNSSCGQIIIWYFIRHCVVVYLQSKLDIQLLELKCNVHPLDDIANKSASTLKDYDVFKNISQGSHTKNMGQNKTFSRLLQYPTVVFLMPHTHFTNHNYKTKHTEKYIKDGHFISN